MKSSKRFLGQQDSEQKSNYGILKPKLIHNANCTMHLLQTLQGVGGVRALVRNNIKLIDKAEVPILPLCSVSGAESANRNCCRVSVSWQLAWSYLPGNPEPVGEESA